MATLLVALYDATSVVLTELQLSVVYTIVTFFTARLSVTLTETVTASLGVGDEGWTMGVPMTGGIVSAGAWTMAGMARAQRTARARNRDFRILFKTYRSYDRLSLKLPESLLVIGLSGFRLVRERWVLVSENLILNVLLTAT